MTTMPHSNNVKKKKTKIISAKGLEKGENKRIIITSQTKIAEEPNLLQNIVSEDLPKPTIAQQ